MSNQYTMIIIDDDELTLKVTTEVCSSSLDYDCINFSSSKDALDYILLNSSSVVCIVSDLEMPIMTGFDIRSKMLDEGLGEIPFIILSGVQNVELDTKGLELKLGGILKKPLQNEELIKLIEELSEERFTAIQEEIELRSSFIEESEPMLEEIENLILGLEKDPEDINILNTYFRLLHTVKGTAACVGLKSVATYTHKYEDLIGKIKNEGMVAGKAITDILLKGLDDLREMCAKIKSREQFEFEITELVKIFDTANIIKIEAGAKKTEVVGAKDIPKEFSEEEKINVSLALLDNFLFQSGELTVLRNMIIRNYQILEQKYAQDKDFEVLGDTLVEFHKVSSGIQNQIAELRKVSLLTVFKPIRRVVRDVGSDLGKKVKLTTNGEKLRVDNSIAKILNNCLVHLIRNAIDHGIEKPSDREEKGKPSEGTLSVNIFEDGEYIKIEVTDDGAGIDKNILKKKAIEKELFTEDEVEKMSDFQIFALIFHSGFSTALKVTNLSGRGVGMDMVRSSVEDFGGRITIDSTLGEGSTFYLTLPIPRSVMIISSLLIRVGEYNMAVPSSNIDEVILRKNTKDEAGIEWIENSSFFRHQGDLIPLVNLGHILGISEKIISDYKDIFIVVVRVEGSKYGILVDEIGDIEEIVSKRVAAQVQNIKMFMGATLIGDSEVGIILDPKGLADLANIQLKDEFMDESLKSRKKEQEEPNEYMLFKMSKSHNYAINLQWVNRLEEMKSKDVEWSTGVPVIRYRDSFLPLVHIERFLSLSDKTDEEFLKENEAINCIVVEQNEKLVGFMVNSIEDIGKPIGLLDQNIVDRSGVFGGINIAGKTITVIDPEYICDNFKSIDTVKTFKSEFESGSESDDDDQSSDVA